MATHGPHESLELTKDSIFHHSFRSSTNTQNLFFSYPVCMFPCCCCRLKLNPLKRIGTNTSEIQSQMSNIDHIVASRNCALLQSNKLVAYEIYPDREN
ncbi:hypothetical protein BDA96_10G085400 [Sorghum bicolor]|uniref:Uncharacterized protein n=1 Tax=Sorghum bicolor TaxID=4558 RepID=A0A921Q1X5_SORBI|nr:hypothetical protein BDA96_10G085400 [Sorghum bicolor]